MVWSMLWAGLVRHRVLSHYVASLLASKSRSSRQAQIARSSSFAKANNGFRFSLGARSLLAQTTAFAHLLRTYLSSGLRPCRWRRNLHPLRSTLIDACLRKHQWRRSVLGFRLHWRSPYHCHMHGDVSS